MADIDYPSNILPLPLVKGYKNQEEKRMLITDLDSGYRQKRKRFTKVPVIFNMSLMLTQGALSYFQAWFAGTLDYGLNWFNMDVAVGDSLASPTECRFLKDPVYSYLGQVWNVRFTLEGIELNLGTEYDDATLGLIASLGGFEQASLYLDKIDYEINTHFPESGYGPGA